MVGMLVEKFLESDELEVKVRGFKKKWYKLGGLNEGLSNFRSGVEKGFVSEFKEISGLIEKIIDEYPSIHVSLKKHIPGEREKIDTDSKKIMESLSAYQTQVGTNLELLKKFKKDYRNINGYEKELGDLAKEMGDINLKKDKLCGKFEEKSDQYKFISGNISEKKSVKLERLEKDFKEKFESITEKYFVYADGKETNAKDLFIAMQGDPDIASGLTIKDLESPKGFLGFKIKKDSGEKESKIQVLRYVVNEFIEEFKPILQEERSDQGKLRTEFSDLDGLEKTCNDLKRRENEIVKYQGELTGKIESIKKQNQVDFSDYNVILSTREELLVIFKEADSYFKEMFSLIDSALPHLEIETDPEKRSLRDELNVLNEKMSHLLKEKENLGKDLEIIRAEKESLAKGKNQLDEELKNNRSEIFTLNERILQNDMEIVRLNGENEDFIKKNEEKETRIGSLEEKISGLNTEIDGMKGEKERLINSNENKDRELDSLKVQIGELKDSIGQMGNDFISFGEKFQKRMIELEEKINNLAKKEE